MIPPAGRLPGPPGPDEPGGIMRRAASLLLQEGVFGILLWCGAAADLRMRLALSGLGFGVAILWTRRFGSLRPLRWANACLEGTLIYAGAVRVCNLLLLGLGTAPWWR